ncbi:cysteine synthase family protein [Paenibacillus barengoltzii]|uniref:cysteine synthase family protein n=1 Tax=Paenibacillus barengoltzii TaxID=343517 RepID=UPI002DB939D3|nr:cysteine synthase family protein [Paenibacillus barengoltzii]MEC2346700.1 cysteine synthase family protein [Paenibacillus barengoltzii]
MYANHLLDTIGNTPLVKLKGGNGRLFAKLELMNPFGMKDRVAKHIILKAKAEGVLRDGEPIIESSSGTMACGLALVGTYLNHPVHIVTDPRIDRITLAKLKSLGCIIHIVDKMGSNGWQSARLELLHRLRTDMKNAFWPRQYDNYDNPSSYHSLADEIIEKLGKVDYFICSVGSGGSISGTAEKLRQYNPETKIVAVDCTGSVIFGQKDNPNRLQSGLGNSIIAKNVHYQLIDEVHWLNDEEAFNSTLELAEQEKIFAGNSSGSVYKVSRWIADNDSNKTVVALFPDRGDRYFETIYNEDFWIKKQLRRRFKAYPQKIETLTNVDDWSYCDFTKINSKRDLETMLCF